MTPTQSMIRAAIATGAQTPGLIAESTGLTRTQVCSQLIRMVDLGLVVRRARGFYVLPKQIEQEPARTKTPWWSPFVAWSK